MGELTEEKGSQEDGGREDAARGACLMGWVGPVLLGLGGWHGVKGPRVLRAGLPWELFELVELWVLWLPVCYQVQAQKRGFFKCGERYPALRVRVGSRGRGGVGPFIHLCPCCWAQCWTRD